MPEIDAQKDPIAYMGFLANRETIRFLSSFGSNGWSSHRFLMTKVIDKYFPHEYSLMLGRESLTTDARAEYVVYFHKDHLTQMTWVINIAKEYFVTNVETILAKAEDVLGSAERANEWVEKTSATLGGKPVDLAITDEGTKAVLLHLNAISRDSVSDL